MFQLCGPVRNLDPGRLSFPGFCPPCSNGVHLYMYIYKYIYIYPEKGGISRVQVECDERGGPDILDP